MDMNKEKKRGRKRERKRKVSLTSIIIYHFLRGMEEFRLPNP